MQIIFDYLDIIEQLKTQGLTQEEIGTKIGWSRSMVKQYQKLLNDIGTIIFNFCKLHQEGRVPKDGTNVPFDFTEGWFRDSGLNYNLSSVQKVLATQGYQRDLSKLAKERQGERTDLKKNNIEDSESSMLEDQNEDRKPQTRDLIAKK